MSKVTKGVLAAALLLCATFVPAVALAEGALSVEYDQRELIAPFTFGSSPGPISLGWDSAHTLGLKATYQMPFREDRWNWNVGAGFHAGSWSDESSNGNKDELSVNGFHVRAGIDRQFDVGPAQFFCGPGLQFQSSTGTFEQSGGGGSSSEDAETYTVIGVNTRVGTYIPFTDQNYGFVASAGHTVGYGSAEASGAKITQWENESNFNAGIRFDF